MKILLLILAGTMLPLCAESDFDRTVSRLERHLETQRLHIPFLGLLSGLSGFTRPLGVKDFKLAIFEHIDSDRLKMRIPTSDLGPGWNPVVRVTSRTEHVEIFARHESDWVRMLVVTVDGNDGTVVQMSVKPNKVWEMVSEKIRNR